MTDGGSLDSTETLEKQNLHSSWTDLDEYSVDLPTIEYKYIGAMKKKRPKIATIN